MVRLRHVALGAVAHVAAFTAIDTGYLPRRVHRSYSIARPRYAPCYTTVRTRQLRPYGAWFVAILFAANPLQLYSATCRHRKW